MNFSRCYRQAFDPNIIDIYSFENTCKEDSDLFLKDGTAKIFLNANGSKIEGEPVGRCTQGDP